MLAPVSSLGAADVCRKLFGEIGENHLKLHAVGKRAPPLAERGASAHARMSHSKRDNTCPDAR